VTARHAYRSFWPGRCKWSGRVDIADRTFELVWWFDCLVVLNLVFDYSFILCLFLFYNKINKI